MIKIGSCSWTEKTLIKSGEFYPKEVNNAESRLRYYVSKFDVVEVDSTYYAIPHEHTAFLWAERTHEDFTFHIKVYSALTGHGSDIKAMPKDILKLLPEKELEKRHTYIKDPSLLHTVANSFIDSLQPLIKTNKLGLLLFQYPPWFHYSKHSFDYIQFCKELAQGLPIAVEFRHGSWLIPERQDKVFDFLRKNDITYVTADEPQYGTLATVPFVPESTTDTVYFRFHGRNRANWLKKGIETSLRFSYLYSKDELKSFVPYLQQYDKSKKQVYTMFNNCHGGFAMRNALEMMELLKEETDS